jgi:Lar family restriction alleviation protein
MKLKPCPFCGRKTKIKVEQVCPDFDGDGYKVVCECGASGPPEEGDNETVSIMKEEAIAAWNRRVK